MRIRHSKEFLGEGFMREELQRGGGWQGAGVARVGVIKAAPDRQMIPQQLHFILNPL